MIYGNKYTNEASWLPLGNGRRYQMTQREQLTTALDGGVPDRTPYSIYSSFIGEEKLFAAEWMALYEQGLSLCHHVLTVQHVEHGVEDSFEERKENRHTYQIYRNVHPSALLKAQSRTAGPMRMTSSTTYP